MHMVRPFLYLLLGSFLYASAYCLKKYHLPTVNVVTLMFSYSSVVLVLSTIVKAHELNDGTPWFDLNSAIVAIWLIAFGVLFALGDYFFFEGSNAPSITAPMATSVFAMIPVFSSLIEIYVEKKRLNLPQLIACGLIVAGVVLFAYSEDSQTK